jgi:hypothetical protein
VAAQLEGERQPDDSAAYRALAGSPGPVGEGP